MDGHEKTTGFQPTVVVVIVVVGLMFKVFFILRSRWRKGGRNNWIWFASGRNNKSVSSSFPSFSAFFNYVSFFFLLLLSLPLPPSSLPPYPLTEPPPLLPSFTFFFGLGFTGFTVSFPTRFVQVRVFLYLVLTLVLFFSLVFGEISLDLECAYLFVTFNVFLQSFYWVYADIYWVWLGPCVSCRGFIFQVGGAPATNKRPKRFPCFFSSC